VLLAPVAAVAEKMAVMAMKGLVVCVFSALLVKRREVKKMLLAFCLLICF